jgi:hypothetical protein
MADLFTRLAQRTRGPLRGIVPRVPARFEPSTDAAGRPVVGGTRPVAESRAEGPGVVGGTRSGSAAGHGAGPPPAAARAPRGSRADRQVVRPAGGTGPGTDAGSTWPGASARPGGAVRGGRAGSGGTVPDRSAGFGGTGPGEDAGLGEGAGPGEGGPPGGAATISGRASGTGPDVPVDLAAAARGAGRAPLPRPSRSTGQPGPLAAPAGRGFRDRTPEVGIRPAPEAAVPGAATGRGAARSVRISIGRIVVRATPPPAPSGPALPPPPAPRDGLSLSAYLRGDDGRPR